MAKADYNEDLKLKEVKEPVEESAPKELVKDSTPKEPVKSSEPKSESINKNPKDYDRLIAYHEKKANEAKMAKKEAEKAAETAKITAEKKMADSEAAKKALVGRLSELEENYSKLERENRELTLKAQRTEDAAKKIDEFVEMVESLTNEVKELEAVTFAQWDRMKEMIAAMEKLSTEAKKFN